MDRGGKSKWVLLLPYYYIIGGKTNEKLFDMVISDVYGDVLDI